MPDQIYYWQSSARVAKKKRTKKILEIELTAILDSVQTVTIVNYNHVHVHEL